MSLQSSSSSSSPEPDLPKKLSKKSKQKGKGKSDTSPGKNEGTDANWEYKPPDGATLIQNSEDAGDFDWDAIANDDDLDLWLIRVPESIKPKYLENTIVEIPPGNRSVKIGSLNRKHATFDIWSIGEGDQDDIGGEEVKTLSCLLPRKTKGGRLYPAPKPIARRVVVSARAVAPAENPLSTGSIAPYSRPPRESYPKEALKHKFMPYGSLTNIRETDNPDKQPMDVDIPRRPDSPSSPKHKKSKHSRTNSTELKKVKEKKRKGEGDVLPKKSKKAKTS